MLRKTAVALTALGALNATNVQALGLGEVTVHSSLNQPLSAEINLLQIRDLSKSQIIAGLADADDFYLAGVKPTLILSDLNFKLEIKDGKGIIRLSTSDPIKEPFLNFLVEVNWPSGRLVREYTILLDPPVFSAKDLAPRSAPVAPRASSSTAKRMSVAEGAPMPQTSGSNIRTRMEGSQYYVDVRDTLWDIALKTRPDRSVSPQQMMLAIQRMNPDAFINNNINRLRSGVVLNIPTKEQVLSKGLTASVEEVKRQNNAWKGSSPKSKASAEKKTEQLDASKQDSAQSQQAEPEDKSQLRIVSKAPEKSETETAAEEPEDQAVSVDSQALAPEAAVSDELVAKNRELEEQLVVTLEGLDKVERDNAELFERMEKMTEQLESVQRLLTLKDQQMADLTNKLVEAQAKAVQAPPPPPATPPSKSFIDTLMETPAMLAGAGAAILALLLGLLFAIRKRNQAGDDEAAVEQAMAVLEERENTKAEEPVEETVAAEAPAVAEPEALDVPEDDLPEVNVEEDPDDPFNLASEEAEDEFDALISDDLDEQLGDDLDMDLKIDEPVDEDPEMAEFAASLLDDEEYDLAKDSDELDAVEDSVESMEQEIDLDDDLDLDLDESDFGLDEAEQDVTETAEVEAELGDEEEESDDLDFILSEASGDDEVASSEDDIDQGLPEDDSDLDFVVADAIDVDEIADDSAGEVASVADEGLEEDADLDTLDVLLEEDKAEEVDEVSDELESLLDDEAINEARVTKDQVAQVEDGEDDNLVDDGALDELLSQAEESGEDESEVELAASMSSLDLDSLDLDADDSLSVSEESAELEAEQSADIDDLDLGDTDHLADSLDLDMPDEEVAGEVEVAEAIEEEASVELELDQAVEQAPEDAQEVAADAPESSDLDSVADDELESELNLMLEGDENELALEETSVSEDEEELNYLNSEDELGTKIDLARAYIDMDDTDGAKDILEEVIKDGSAEQAAEARKLLDGLS